MSDQWFAGEHPTIAYEDPLCRWAYVYAHVPVQANLLCRVVMECERQSESFGRKLTSENVSITVFGGGPGTQLLGLAIYSLDRAKYEPHEQIEVRVDVIDRVSAWVENVSWIKGEDSEIYSKQFGRRHDWPALFDVHTYPLNLSELNGFGNFTSLFRKDVFVLNYIVSKVSDLDGVLPIMRKMVTGCPVGAHFLFVDRSDGDPTNKIDTLIEMLELEVGSGGRTVDNMDTDEDKNELKLINEFLDRQPRIKWNAVWVLAMKPQRK